MFGAKERERERIGKSEHQALTNSQPSLPLALRPSPVMFALRTPLAPTRRSVAAKASTGNWAPGTEKPKYLEGAPG